MLTLLQIGSGSSEIILGDASLHEAKWQVVKRQAIRYLHVTGSRRAADILENLPFELRRGSNSFGDEFDILYVQLGLEKYHEFERQVERDNLCLPDYSDIADALRSAANTPIRFIAADAILEEPEIVSTPQLRATTPTVERALADMEVLIAKGGAVSGLDRIHTALHGHLRAICNGAGICHGGDEDIAALFKLIRKNHPNLQAHPPGVEAESVLQGLARVVDAMNPARNKKSLAHPNEILLPEAEAMLLVNAARTILHYLNSKLV